jgi:hypothetical protein
MALIAKFSEDSDGVNMIETFEMVVSRVRARETGEGVFSHDGNEAGAEREGDLPDTEPSVNSKGRPASKFFWHLRSWILSSNV